MRDPDTGQELGLLRCYKCKLLISTLTSAYHHVKEVHGWAAVEGFEIKIDIVPSPNE